MKKIIHTKNSPLPIGTYNQAVLVGNTLYCSGQIGINPETDELINQNIEAETKQVMQNLKCLLEAAGMTMENVVKSTIFITNMNNFGKINAIYGSYFDEKTAPARETVQVVCLPKNMNVEISVIAYK